MRFSILFTTLLSSAALATPFARSKSGIEARASKKPDNGPAVAKDFLVINEQTTRLNTTLTRFHRGARTVVGAYNVRKQALNISSELKTLTADVSASGNFSYNHTLEVATNFLNALSVIKDTLATLERKHIVVTHAVFGFGDLSKTVYNVLSELRGQAAAVAPHLVYRLDPDTGLQRAAPNFVTQLLDAFDEAIAAFKTCSGEVCLPAIPDSFPV